MSAGSLALSATQCRAKLRTLVIPGIAILCVLVRFTFAYLRSSVPFQFNYEEGNVLNAGLRIMSGSTPYPKLDSFPYVINPYGPVGYALTALGMKLFGVSLLGPRLLVLAAGAGIIFCIINFSRHYGVSWEIALAIGATFLCLPLVWGWFPLLRVDMWAVLLSLLGLCAYARNPGRWQIPAVVFGLALLTKPTALAAPAACFVELWIQGRVGRGLRLLLLTAIVVVTGAFSLGGDPVYHMLKTHPDPVSLKHLLNMYWAVVEHSVLFVAILIYAVSFKFRWTSQTRLPWIYFALCCVTASSGAKIGSDTNHFLELQAALSILTALSIRQLIENGNQLARPFLVAVVALAAILTFMPLILPPVLPKLFPSQLVQTGQCSEAYSFVRSFPGERVLSEDVSALVLGKKPVLVSNPFVMTQLGDSVAWSQGRLDQLTDRRYFDLILLGRSAPGRWSRSFLQSLRQNYKPVREYQCAPLSSAFVPRESDEVSRDSH